MMWMNYLGGKMKWKGRGHDNGACVGGKSEVLATFWSENVGIGITCGASEKIGCETVNCL